MLLERDPLERENSDVREIQSMLNKALENANKLYPSSSMLGYGCLNSYLNTLHIPNYNYHIPSDWEKIKEPLDGRFGKKTENAVKCFQTFSYITPNGKVDDETYNQLKGFSSIDFNNLQDQLLGQQIKVSNPSNLIDKLLEFEPYDSFAHDFCKFIDEVIKELDKLEKEETILKEQEDRYNKKRQKGQLKKQQCRHILNQLKIILTDSGNHKPNTKQVKICLEIAKNKLTERIDNLRKNKSKIILDKLPYKIAVIIKKYPRIIGYIRFLNKIPGLQWGKVIYHKYKSTEALWNGDFEKALEEDILCRIYLGTNIITDAFIVRGNFTGWLCCFILFLVLDYFLLNDSEDTLFPTRNFVRDIIKL